MKKCKTDEYRSYAHSERPYFVFEKIPKCSNPIMFYSSDSDNDTYTSKRNVIKTCFMEHKTHYIKHIDVSVE